MEVAHEISPEEAWTCMRGFSIIRPAAGEGFLRLLSEYWPAALAAVVNNATGARGGHVYHDGLCDAEDKICEGALSTGEDGFENPLSFAGESPSIPARLLRH